MGGPHQRGAIIDALMASSSQRTPGASINLTASAHDANPGLCRHFWHLCRHATPHGGFQVLRRLAQRLPTWGFTSSGDGHFQRTGLDAERVVECHGSLARMQCFKPCSKEVGSAERQRLGRRLTLIECGARTAVPRLRREGGKLLERSAQARLLRINPAPEPERLPGTRVLALSAREALLALEPRLAEGERPRPWARARGECWGWSTARPEARAPSHP